MRRGLLLAPVLAVLAACTVGPDYRRPDVPLPSFYRGLDPLAPPEPGSLGDLAWWTVFGDETLQAGDRAIVFTQTERAAEVEQAL